MQLQPEDKVRNQPQCALTLSELRRVVSNDSNTDHAVDLAVADLMQQGIVVQARPAVVMALLRTLEPIHNN